MRTHMRVTITMRTEDGKTLHIRKACLCGRAAAAEHLQGTRIIP